MNRLHELFQTKKKQILCIYYTAGYPDINSTDKILNILQNLNVDLIEIGIPYSDSLVDGKIIQKSNQISLKNGMNVSLLFEQLTSVKQEIKLPIILMGCFNQIYQFGVEIFLKKCNELAISGLIIPDLPYEIYLDKYQQLFQKYSLSIIFLITPQTNNTRILFLDHITNGFLYLVSSSSITGEIDFFGEQQLSFFQRIKKLSIKKPKLIGFGIKNKYTFELSCKYANGGIIGSDFIKSLDKKNLEKSIKKYIHSIQFIN
ncbi:tryptophan synthase subunit alpha [Blattabacterium cuenoti]|uniref:tryptophan synthase subunit alpha n=1 Tax=Blattabacterium cuenoti TaxID=1653831 RepID=UPI00163C0F47|nr:tryptophan synthase subunit alpha [Blattabacterium cuenoti]